MKRVSVATAKNFDFILYRIPKELVGAGVPSDPKHSIYMGIFRRHGGRLLPIIEDGFSQPVINFGIRYR